MFSVCSSPSHIDLLSIFFFHQKINIKCQRLRKSGDSRMDVLTSGVFLLESSSRPKYYLGLSRHPTSKRHVLDISRFSKRREGSQSWQWKENHVAPFLKSIPIENRWTLEPTGRLGHFHLKNESGLYLSLVDKSTNRHPKFFVNSELKEAFEIKPTKTTVFLDGAAPFRFYSHNISSATQANELTGSEREFVRHCQLKYRDTTVKTSFFSKCTLNVLLDIKRLSRYGMTPDVLFFQEVRDRHYGERLGSFIQKSNPEKDYEVFIGQVQRVKKSDLFLLTVISKPSLGITDREDIQDLGILTIVESSGRPCQAFYVKKHKLVLYNCHWPQKWETDSQSERFVIGAQYLLGRIRNQRVDRVIVAGDLNTEVTRFSLNHNRQRFNFDSQSLERVITCCCKSEFTGQGDFILDSRKGHTFFGVPPFYSLKEDWSQCDTRPTSDHYPVILTTWL